MITTTKPVHQFLCTLFFAAALGASAEAQILQISDNFNLNGTTRTAGAALNGTSPQVGADTWAGSGAVFTSGGMLTSSANNQTIVGEINFTLSATTTTTVQTDVVLGGSNYAGLGFTSAKNTGNFFSADDQVFALLSATNVFLFDSSNGGSHLLGNIPVTTATGISNTFALNFNPATNKASVIVNGTTYFAGTSVAPIAAVTTAAFYEDGIPTPGNATIDNFRVSTVPEPATYAYLVAGGAALFVWSRRKTRQKFVA